MGLDIWLQPKPCDHCGHEGEIEEFSYTWNVAPMWYAIYPDAETMINIDGLTGEESKPVLEYAIQQMINRKKEMQALNPPNNFGSYDGFRKLLIKMHASALEMPEAVWNSWR
jgi:hypothetical protein